MTKHVPTSSLLGAAIAMLVASPALCRPAVASLCRADEPRLFACPIGRKLVSICGKGAGAVYRFGRKGRVEMEAYGPTVSQRGYAGGGEAQVAFLHQGYTYAVYDSTVRTRFTPDGRHDAAISQGLLVVKGGRVLSDRPCGLGGDTGLPADGYEDMAPGAMVDH